MDQKILFDGLASYLCVVVIITLHEFGHAWMAWKCGDDTAHSEGRVTLNPIAHMDMIGTVILPLIVVFLSASGSGLGRFIIGWGKPVPVNLSRLRHPRRDDILVSMAGPAMNVVLAVAVMIIGRMAELANWGVVQDAAVQLAFISMFLCFFNLLPVPPLDGSHVVKNLIRMSHETYARISQYGFFIVIVLVQIPAVQTLLGVCTIGSMTFMAWALRFGTGLQ